MAARALAMLATLLGAPGAAEPQTPPVGEARAGRSAAPEEEALAVIVNRSNTVDELEFDELRRIFLAERSHWPNGRRITVAMRDPGQPEREAALRLIYGMTEKEFGRYFLHAVFTGEVLSAPKRLATSDVMRRFVFNLPGAIGYVRAADVDGTVKVLRVDGRGPGEPGYRLADRPAAPKARSR